MTKEEAKEKMFNQWQEFLENNIDYAGISEAYKMAISALEQEPCDDVVSRQAVINLIKGCNSALEEPSIFDCHNAGVKFEQYVIALPSVRPQEPKMGHCKDCKWWKDSDGLYRRGNHAESQCPINRREVFEGNGYCYMFEPRESESKHYAELAKSYVQGLQAGLAELGNGLLP